MVDSETTDTASEAAEAAPPQGSRKPGLQPSSAILPHPLFWIVAFIVLALDQATKEWALRTLQFEPPLVLIEGVLDLTFVRNTGAAFGLLAGNNFALGAVAVVLIAIGYFFGGHLGWHRRDVSLVGGLLLGGAVGNLIDRVRHGYVVDFIDVDLQFYDWPVFNVADSAITVCVVFLVFRILFSPEESSQAEAAEEKPGSESSKAA